MRANGPNYHDLINRMERMQKKMSKEELGRVFTTELSREAKSFPVKGKVSRQGDKAIFSATVPLNKKRQVQESLTTAREHLKETTRHVVRDSVKRY